MLTESRAYQFLMLDLIHLCKCKLVDCSICSYLYIKLDDFFNKETA